ncbi:zinc-dependent metalloprotease [Psychroflexus montanilacus]|uniref:zinc-dependent metalloprotease n=1 Tax=Psychroflexus montanilacus TaxID=2873598 RepID=UPI001CCEB2C0|nr:zinc-dependent metalloprotease family protein [Psychroflexus montanilacus]MBZ9652456.1 M12 family metallo-peptidase [Psychroflexus montanilacus]
MKLFTTKLFIGFIFSILISTYGYSQNQDSYWTLVEAIEVNQSNAVLDRSVPSKSSFLSLDIESMEKLLENVPKRKSSRSSKKTLDFPNAEGVLESFEIFEASVMTPELQKQFPTTRSFIGKGIEDPAAILRFSISKEKGLSSMVLSDGKTVFIEPYHPEENLYISFINSVTDDSSEDGFECLTETLPVENPISDEDFKALKNADDGSLRTFRLALACTVEYAQFHGGTLEDVMAAMNTTMTRVNGIYERDMGLTMVMVPNESIIFLGPNPSSDPFSNENVGEMLGQNQQVCDDNIGFENYDIGHVFGTGGGGVAYLNSPCTGIKAGGVTGQSSPVGDTFDVDYVAHEMGHQFGGNHTQNNSCNRTGVSVEPGSASTIMGYAGICPPNVQSNSDDYFHGENIKEMWLNISQGNSTCAEQTETSNTPPSADAGSDYFIPKSTPFILKGNATDTDVDDVLTYNWEQNDRTPAPMPPQSTSTVGPAFRSLSPSVSPDRFMPDFSTVLSGSLSSTWEVVPSVARTMSFLLTVRDNSVLVGNTSSDEMLVTTVDTTPFTVQTPPASASGSTLTVNWTVGESNIAPINCQNVTIYFSENGVDFSTVLASEIPNSGSAEITLPEVQDGTQAKILVEAADHIFYAVSDFFEISSEPDFSINAMITDRSICNLDTASYDFEFVTSNGFSESTTFSATGPDEAIFDFTPSSLDEAGSFTLNVSNLLNVSANDYTLEISATSTNLTKSVTVNLTIEDGTCESVANTSFDTSTTGVIINDGETDILSNLNTGKPSGYSDFTDITTDLVINQNYELTVNANSDGDYQIITYVWIDWNQNCSFDDPGELYNLGRSQDLFNQPTSNSPLAFSVPSDAILGNTTMRVTTKYTPSNANDFPLPCENNHDGEVEDYTIHVKSTLSQASFALQNLRIYPNPSQGKFNVEFFVENSTEVKLKIFDIRGRSLMNKTYDVFGNFSQELNLNNLSTGVYLMELNDGTNNFTKKIIIE